MGSVQRPTRSAADGFTNKKWQIEEESVSKCLATCRQVDPVAPP